MQAAGFSNVDWESRWERGGKTVRFAMLNPTVGQFNHDHIVRCQKSTGQPWLDLTLRWHNIGAFIVGTGFRGVDFSRRIIRNPEEQCWCQNKDKGEFASSAAGTS